MNSSIDDYATFPSENTAAVANQLLDFYRSGLEHNLDSLMLTFNERDVSGGDFFREARIFPESIDLASDDYAPADLCHPDDVPCVTNMYVTGLEGISEHYPECFEIPFLTAKLLISSASVLQEEVAFEDLEEDEDLRELTKYSVQFLEEAAFQAEYALENLREYIRDTESSELLCYRSAMLYALGNAHLRRADIIVDSLYADESNPRVQEHAENAAFAFEEMFKGPIMSRELAAEAMDDWGRAIQYKGNPDEQHLGLLYRGLARKEREQDTYFIQEQ